MIYFDYSATTPMHPRALEAYDEASTLYFGNPNTPYPLGKDAYSLLEQAKKTILAYFLLQQTKNEIVFTSGATEANNLAIKGTAYANATWGKHIITTRNEHPSVLAPMAELQKAGFEVDFVDLDANGQVDLDALRQLVREDTILVSVQTVNSELGTIQPVEAIFAIAHARSPGCVVHTDATQAIGKITPTYALVDMVSFSAHKIYGPKGVGGLMLRPSLNLIPQITGGHSWSKLRSGTPPVPLIHSMGVAFLELIKHEVEQQKEVAQLRKMFLNELISIPSIKPNLPAKGVPHIFNISCLGYSSKETVNYLINKGFAVSAHSACSGEEEISQPVLQLTQDEARARSSIRISLSHLSTKEEVLALVKALRQRRMLA